MSCAARLCLPLVLLALVLPALASCGGEDMENQQKLMNYRAAVAFPDRTSAQRPPAGTVPREADPAGAPGAGRPAATEALLARGRERYAIYCTPCHGPQGRGDGEVVQRGFPAPPSYHAPRLLAAPAAHFYEVITEGYGVMYGYADRVAPRDRWAITAYIRALQLALAPQAGAGVQGRGRAVPAAEAAEEGADER